MADSVPKPADIHFNVAKQKNAHSLFNQLSSCAMFNYAIIIEREDAVIMLICFTVLLAAAARNDATIPAELAKSLLLDSLTTMLSLRIFMRSFLNRNDFHSSMFMIT